MTPMRWIGLVVASCAVAGAAAAQDPVAAVRGDRARAITAGVANDNRTGFVGSGVNLSADGDDKVVSLSLARSWDGPGGGSSLTYSNLTAKLSTDVSEKADKGGFFITDSGITKGTALEIGFSQARTRSAPVPITPAQLLEMHNRARAACAEAATTAAVKKQCADTTTPLDDSLFKAYLSPADLEALADNEFKSNPLWLWGVTGSVGYKAHKFRDTTTLAKGDVDRIPMSASIYVGASFPALGAAYAGGGFEYKQEYKDADARTLCQPVPATGPQECFSGSFGKPTRNITEAVFLVVRKQWAVSALDLQLGLQIKPAHDFRTDLEGVETTLYFVPAANTRLRGGVRAKWQEDDDDPKTDGFVIGLFVGSAF